MAEFSYSSLRWRRLARAAKRRDGSSCSVARLIGGDCSGSLHAHHVRPARGYPELAYDLSNVITACSAHHPVLEALRRRIVGALEKGEPKVPRCSHYHRYPGAKEECERRLARAAAAI